MLSSTTRTCCLRPQGKREARSQDQGCAQELTHPTLLQGRTRASRFLMVLPPLPGLRDKREARSKYQGCTQEFTHPFPQEVDSYHLIELRDNDPDPLQTPSTCSGSMDPSTSSGSMDMGGVENAYLIGPNTTIWLYHGYGCGEAARIGAALVRYGAEWRHGQAGESA